MAIGIGGGLGTHHHRVIRFYPFTVYAHIRGLFNPPDLGQSEWYIRFHKRTTDSIFDHRGLVPLVWVSSAGRTQ